MSIIVLLCLLFGVAAILLLVLFLLQRRQLNALETVSQAGAAHRHRRLAQQPHRTAHRSARAGRHGDRRESSAGARRRRGGPASRAGSAPIGSLGRSGARGGADPRPRRSATPTRSSPICWAAAPRNCSGGGSRTWCRRTTTELVADNMRRRLAGEPAAERYEVDLVGRSGQSARLELSSWPVDYEGERALLIVGVEVLPTQTRAGAAGRDRSLALAPGARVAVRGADHDRCRRPGGLPQSGGRASAGRGGRGGRRHHARGAGTRRRRRPIASCWPSRCARRWLSARR